jgi:hypothetical protein
LPRKRLDFLFHTNTPGGTLAATQTASFTVIKITLIVAFLIHMYGTIRTEQVTDTALHTLFFIPYGLAVTPVLIVMKIFGNEQVNHRTSFPQRIF